MINLSPGILNINNFSETVYTMGEHQGTLQIECYDICMKTKLVLTHFGGTFGTLRFDERSFICTLLDFTPYWDCKPNNAIHADSPGVYTSDKILYLSTEDIINLKCDVNDGSVVYGIREPILFSFSLDKPAG